MAVVISQAGQDEHPRAKGTPKEKTGDGRGGGGYISILLNLYLSVSPIDTAILNLYLSIYLSNRYGDKYLPFPSLERGRGE